MRPPIFFCNSHALLGESRGLENIFCKFYEINSSQEFFLYCKNFGVDGNQGIPPGIMHPVLTVLVCLFRVLLVPWLPVFILGPQIVPRLLACAFHGPPPSRTFLCLLSPAPLPTVQIWGLTIRAVCNRAGPI